MVTQRTANPCTPVRFRARPPSHHIMSTILPPTGAEVAHFRGRRDLARCQSRVTFLCMDRLTPLLDRTPTPDTLRTLGKDDLPQLADELRAEIIAAASETGGHFGGGLGVVELTVALHYVFDTPRDRLIWDVSHQAYPHKILTGRREPHPFHPPEDRPLWLHQAEREPLRSLRSGPQFNLDLGRPRHGACPRPHGRHQQCDCHHR